MRVSITWAILEIFHQVVGQILSLLVMECRVPLIRLTGEHQQIQLARTTQKNEDEVFRVILFRTPIAFARLTLRV
jgi:hypothetical protein